MYPVCISREDLSNANFKSPLIVTCTLSIIDLYLLFIIPAPNSASGQKPAGDWSSLKTCKRSTPSTPVTPRADGASGSDAPTTESCTLTNKNERHNFTDDKPAKSKKVSTSKV